MTYLKQSFSNSILLLFLCLSLSACFKDLPDKIVFYQNNFDNNTKANFSIYSSAGLIDSLKITSFNNSKVFGRFNSNYVLFKMDTLPAHNAIKIEFDLYLHDQWDGNHLPPGAAYPDIWQMAIDNNPVILTTFSNGAYPQSYPNNYQPNMINSPALSNSWGVLPGVCSNEGKANN